MKKLTSAELVRLGLMTLTLLLCGFFYSSLAVAGRLPFSSFVIGAWDPYYRVLLSGIASVLFLTLALPLYTAAPWGGSKIRFAAVLVTSVLTLVHFCSQASWYLKFGRPLLIRETLLSVGGQFALLAVLWLTWAIARRGIRSAHFAVAWLASFYSVFVGGTSFTYMG